MSQSPDVRLPVKVTPFQHQIDAYLFACTLFDIDTMDEPQESK